MIGKSAGKWAVKHCKGKDKGKVIGTFESKEEAMAQHKAIQASKRSKKAAKKAIRSGKALEVRD